MTPQTQTHPTKPDPHTQGRSTPAVALCLSVLAGSLAIGGCQRPGVSLSADPRQAPIFQSAAPAPSPQPPTAAGVNYPMAGAIAAMLLPIIGMIIVIFGFRLVKLVFTTANNNKPPTP